MLSPDPVTQAPENGQNYNRYSYAFNNPLRFIDPSGFVFEPPGFPIACNGDREISCGDFVRKYVNADLDGLTDDYDAYDGYEDFLADGGVDAFIAAEQVATNGDIDTYDGGIVDLTAHEINGGHTIRDHVGKSDAFLRRQLLEVRGRSGNVFKFKGAHSTFRSLQSANRLVSAVLNQQKAKLNEWLQSGNKEGLELEQSFNFSTGRIAYRKGRLAVDVPGPIFIGDANAVRVFIVPDKTRPEGFRIHSAYPTIGDE
ncbi:MAG: RNase A-like domain-containing protein [Bacteroidota bacterium]